MHCTIVHVIIVHLKDVHVIYVHVKGAHVKESLIKKAITHIDSHKLIEVLKLTTNKPKFKLQSLN